ncbi:MAG: hypothetical protein II850_03460 [Fibrobacter sp.]|nr:hypothetical protein [Fibrobacter sp.]
MSYYDNLKKKQIFCASKVMELTGCKPTAAASLIKKLLAIEMIEPIAGHGKGKYRAKG